MHVHLCGFCCTDGGPLKFLHLLRCHVLCNVDSYYSCHLHEYHIQISGYHTSNTRSFGCWLFGDATADLAILSSFLLKTNVAESVVVVD